MPFTITPPLGWVTDHKVSNTVVEENSTPRSYRVEVPHGTFCRNRHHFIYMTGTESDDALGRPRLPETFDNAHTYTSVASVSLPGLTLGCANSLRP